MKEILDFYRQEIDDSKILGSLNLQTGNYF